MKLLQLMYFNTVCETGSTVKAAEQLSVSQPTISLAIKELEEEFRALLFFRNKKRLIPTAYGELLFKLSKDLLHNAQNVSEIMTDTIRKRNKIRLGITPMLATQLIPPILRKYSTESNSIHFVVTEGSQNKLFSLLDHNEVDIIISSYNDDLASKYESVVLTDMEFWFCVSKSHPLSNRKIVTIDDIEKETFVAFESMPYSSIMQFFALYKKTPNIVYKSNQLSTIVSIISDNLACAFLYPKAIEAQYSNLNVIPIEPRITKNVAAFWKKDTYIFSETKHLLSVVKKLGHDFI